MLDPITARLRVNAPTVIHETIDGEVIIIHLKTGTYYSVRGSGADVWSVLDASPGLTPPEVVGALASSFDTSPEEMLPTVARFLEELKAEDLVVDGAEHALTGAVAAVDSNEGAVRAFTPPALEKYTDMTDLVLLDPVHEVDATGWPQARPEQSPAGEAA